MVDMSSQSRVDILVKSLNEERHIEECIRSAVAEAESVGGKVILVDSCSSDNTVAISRNFPIKIVQFSNPKDRGCGAAVQLGFQYVKAPFLYVLDADMVLQKGFLRHALQALEDDPTLAGVGGRLQDKTVITEYDRHRKRMADKIFADVDVDELGGGGLYRTSAINSVGYLAHAGLPAFEEAELGLRLRSHGWRLRRLSRVSVVHSGHKESDFQMLQRLWRNGRAQATGKLIKASWGKAWFFGAVRKQRHLMIVPFFYIAPAFFLLFFSSLSAVLVFVSLLLFFALYFSIRDRSLRSGVVKLIVYHFFFVSCLVGLFKRVPNPGWRIDSFVLFDGCLG